ncbi:Hypothetical predicted protein [Scomber scombrus]|uniref:Uncharacterized protein n=1 Tax=Scomber scombrus TaxID=13677 RepID=A0AAV1PFC2_SCOSC
MLFPYSSHNIRLVMDIGVHDASDPCRFLTPTTAFRSDRDIGHYDACDLCHLPTRTAAFRLLVDIGSKMPATHAVSSLRLQRFA